jgi:CRISPR/Cas system-associated exonuclease Cas4 (RecB family)
MRNIRASEIGVFLYCQRAWWYRNQGIEPTNQAELSAGSAMHRQHGRKVLLAGLLRVVAWVLFLTAVFLITFQIAQQVIH